MTYNSKSYDNTPNVRRDFGRGDIGGRQDFNLKPCERDYDLQIINNMKIEIEIWNKFPTVTMLTFSLLEKPLPFPCQNTRMQSLAL